MNIAAKGRELNKLLQISRILRRLQGARREHNELCDRRATQKTAEKTIIWGNLFNVRS
jgi:hypothetical protein